MHQHVKAITREHVTREHAKTASQNKKRLIKNAIVIAQNKLARPKLISHRSSHSSLLFSQLPLMAKKTGPKLAGINISFKKLLAHYYSLFNASKD